MKTPRYMRTIETTPPKDSSSSRYSKIEQCMDALLEQFDDMDIRERIATLTAVARIEFAHMKLREQHYDIANSGSAVKRYEAAFANNATRKRKRVAGSPALLTSVKDDDDELEY